MNVESAMADTLKILAISGSLRKLSTNTGLLRAAKELAPVGVEITIGDISELPMYNQDLESEDLPECAVKLRARLAASNGLLLATPEYNYNVSGPTKNFIDWVSRPYGKASLSGKPTAILGASAGMSGTIRAQAALRQSFVLNNVPCMLQPEIYVANSGSKFDENANLTDLPTRDLLSKFLVAFEAWVRKMKPAN